MSLQHAAKYLAQHGRGKDTMLVHMTPREVGGLQALAKASGGSLSVNPNTGLPEAGFLDSLLPMIIGAGAMMIPGMQPWGAAALVGGLQAARTGSLTKGLTAGLGAYGGAGLTSGLMGVGGSSLAGQGAGETLFPNVTPDNLQLHNPATVSTIGEGAPVGFTPDVMSIEQMQAAQSGSPFQEATLAELDKAQQANNAMRTAALEQQTAANVLKPQVYTAPEFSSMDKIKAGLSATTDNLSSAGNFLKDNARYAMAAASPVISELGQTTPPATASSGPNPYRYRFERGEASPFPSLSRSGVEQSYFPNMRYVPYAGGGAVEAMSDANAIGANTGFPMADIQRGAYATPYQQPISQNVVTGAQDTRTDPYTGTERLAEGGVAKQNPLLESPYFPGRYEAGASDTAPAPAPSSPGQGISSGLTDLGLGLMGLAESAPGLATGIAGAIGSGIAGQQADAMGQAQSAMEGMNASPGIVAISDTNGNVIGVVTNDSISVADAAFGDAASAAASGVGPGGAPGGAGGDGGTGDAASAVGDGGGDGSASASGGDGEANGGLLRRKYARGGLSDLGGYSDGGRLLRGPGDGVSDSIPAVIGKRQPARLADGEFVVPARIVSELGNGSTEAGARKLYAMLDRVQKARGKTVGKGKVAKDSRADKYLPA